MQVLFIARYSSFQIQPMAINPYVCLTHQFVIQTLTQPIHIPNQTHKSMFQTSTQHIYMLNQTHNSLIQT